VQLKNQVSFADLNKGQHKRQSDQANASYKVNNDEERYRDPAIMGNMFYNNLEGMKEWNNETPVHPSNNIYQEKTEFRRTFRTPERGAESGPHGG